jgi:DNA-binding transcriptional ArsR family regulator
MATKKNTRAPRFEDDGRLGEAELLRALGHPLRIKILAFTAERVTSPNEIARQINEVVGNVGYHARVLRDAGLIELVEEKPVRGAVEHFYRAVERPWFDEDCWSQFAPEVKRAISSYGVDLVVQDAARALRSGTFDSRDARHLSRAPMLLDEVGFSNINKIFDQALDAVLAEQAASDERRRASREKGIPTIAAMACFEVPPRNGNGLGA